MYILATGTIQVLKRANGVVAFRRVWFLKPGCGMLRRGNPNLDQTFLGLCYQSLLHHWTKQATWPPSPFPLQVGAGSGSVVREKHRGLAEKL